MLAVPYESPYVAPASGRRNGLERNSLGVPSPLLCVGAMRTVVGYLVGFACSVLAALTGLVAFLPLGALPFRRAKQVAMLLGSLGGGFAAAWTGDGILHFFHLQAGWPFFLVLMAIFLVIESEHASARRLSLPMAIVAQVGGLVIGWITLPR